MKYKNILVFLSLWVVCISVMSNEPDSAYLYAYSVHPNKGLNFAWSSDGKNWQPIGQEHSYLKCDYGRWGSDKRMYEPIVSQDETGKWHCAWKLNETDGYGHASSSNLIYWGSQTYTKTPFINYQNRIATEKLQQLEENAKVAVAGKHSGQVHYVAFSLIQGLINEKMRVDYWNTLTGEKMKDDTTRFAYLKSIQADITIDAHNSKTISDKLIGIFFEDINYAADGGLYAELIQNRDFEYNLADREYHDKTWNERKAWSGKFEIDTLAPIHPNNLHYAVISSQQNIINEGWDGITLRKGEKYNFSLFVKTIEGKNGKLKIELVNNKGNSIGNALISNISAIWKKRFVSITATENIQDAKLQITIQSDSKIAVDMVSLFPEKTFKNRTNGLRTDLAQILADLKPQFVRFPGGCVAHGDGLQNIYRWKNSIGPLESRTPMRNLWGYHQTLGLGYYEYFLFCEDIGAEPLPVLAAGVPCQNSAKGHQHFGGQQGGIPMCEMEAYIQDILDLIEWANGDAKTTKWGKIRAQSGHPDPFHLKYIGIGNEDLISDIFKERFTMIFNRIKTEYPEITVIGTVGPTFEGTDYQEGWNLAEKLNVPMVDEHYYQSPGWFIYHQDFYDRYDRNKSHVYLGEYASHLPGRPNNLETALSEALYLTAIERNGDVVELTSYAPLLAKEKHTQWNPDLIYFSNTEVHKTVGYEVQKLYGNNCGNEYIQSSIHISDSNPKVQARIAKSVVRDSQTGDIIVKLVNMLPIEVKSELSFKNLDFENVTGIKTVLTGRPTDKKLIPESSEIKISETMQYNMPAYSFSIIRIKKQV